MDALMGKTGTQKKVEFILSQSRDLTADEIVEKAKENGVTGISKQYVYEMRSKNGTKPRVGKPAAPKTRKGSKPTITKTAFVLSQPMTMDANEVVARGRKVGQILKKKFVYVIRSNHRSKLRKQGGKTASASTQRSEAKPRIVRNPGATTRLGGAQEQTLRAAIKAVGIDRAKEVFHEFVVKRAEEFAALEKQLR
jgi:hypothetical protein